MVEFRPVLSQLNLPKKAVLEPYEPFFASAQSLSFVAETLSLGDYKEFLESTFEISSSRMVETLSASNRELSKRWKGVALVIGALLLSGSLVMGIHFGLGIRITDYPLLVSGIGAAAFGGLLLGLSLAKVHLSYRKRDSLGLSKQETLTQAEASRWLKIDAISGIQEIIDIHRRVLHGLDEDLALWQLPLPFKTPSYLERRTAMEKAVSKQKKIEEGLIQLGEQLIEFYGRT